MFCWIISSSLCWWVWNVLKPSLFSLDIIHMQCFQILTRGSKLFKLLRHVRTRGGGTSQACAKANTAIFLEEDRMAAVSMKSVVVVIVVMKIKSRILWGLDKCSPLNYIFSPWFSLEKGSCCLVQTSWCRWDWPSTCNPPASTFRDWDFRRVPGCQIDVFLDKTPCIITTGHHQGFVEFNSPSCLLCHLKTI